MQELSLNILDIAQNSVRAGADLIRILVDEQPADDTLTIVVEDNGCGMAPEQLERFLPPGPPARWGWASPFSRWARR